MSLELTTSKLVNYLRLCNFQLYPRNCSLGYEECFHDSNIHYFSKKYLFLYISHSSLEISVVTKFTYLARNTSEWRSRARRVELCGCLHSSWTLKTILRTLGFGYSKDVLIWLFPRNSSFFPWKRNDSSLAKLIYAQRNLWNWSMHKETGHTLVFRVMITSHRWKWTSRK